MGQRIDDNNREQELMEEAKKAAHIEKILTPEGFAETMKGLQNSPSNFELTKRFDALENEIKEKLSLWLSDVNEPIHKQIDNLQERITKLEALVKGHPHDVQEED